MSDDTKPSDKWLREAMEDAEIGGAAFEENVALANKAVMQSGGQELMDALIASGVGRNKTVIRALAQIGKQSAGPRSEKQRLQQEFPASPGMWQHLPD